MGLETLTGESMTKKEEDQGNDQIGTETKKVDQTPMRATEKIDRIKDLIEEYKAKKS